MYRRWAHQGTYYGFTSYSSVTAAMGTFDCDEHQLGEGFLIHRMFTTRYYLMAMVALFYRATLLDFSERTALVSKQLYLDQEDGRFAIENIQLANDLRGDFLHFSNYWHFEELANKDEESDHFTMQCREYRIGPMKAEIEEEIEKLNASLHNYHQFRNTEAVNRLAVLSLMLGAGAVVTGFFGMNFGRGFARLFFEPGAKPRDFPLPGCGVCRFDRLRRDHLRVLCRGEELVRLSGDPGAPFFFDPRARRQQSSKGPPSTGLKSGGPL